MNDKKKGQISKFIEFVHDASLGNLHSSPESLKRFDDGLAVLLKKAKEAQAHSWISKAKGEIAAFAEQSIKAVSSKFAGLSRQQLLAEIKKQIDGGLNFQHQFRNKKPDDLSDDELRSILDDQEILKDLKKGAPKDGSGESES